MMKLTKRIEASVIEQLNWDSRVNDTNIEVAMDGACVVLTGTVPSYSDRATASETVFTVPGVADVENRLQVDFPSTLVIPTDEELQLRVSQHLAWSPTVDAGQIEVTVDHGEVTLDGTVDSYWKTIAAQQLVGDVMGVRSIKNRLAIVPRENKADDATARDIMDALDRSEIVSVEAIDVQVSQGIVTISGTVPDYYTYKRIFDIVRFTFGVIDVHNRLSIIG